MQVSADGQSWRKDACARHDLKHPWRKKQPESDLFSPAGDASAIMDGIGKRTSAKAGTLSLWRPLMRARWNDTVIAESDDTVVVEGNHYFPPDSVNQDLLIASDTTTVCPWKGTASYYSLSVDGKENPDAAWYYPHPKDAAAQIKDHVAFWRGVTVED
jgi:uncharacterized protein (DUF427 family)